MINLNYISSGDDLISEHGFYQDNLIYLEGVINQVLARLDMLRAYQAMHHLRDPIEHYSARIKSAQSMKEKLKRRGLPVTVEAALAEVYDAAGVRVICGFIDDVYTVAENLRNQSDFEIVEEKDYIRHPKPNGYRSYHMIIKVPVHTPNQVWHMYAEIQLRTIAMDCWASLEHQLKYKHEIQNQDMIVAELKRCADEIASTDLTLQTIRELINEASDPKPWDREPEADENRISRSKKRGGTHR